MCQAQWVTSLAPAIRARGQTFQPLGTSRSHRNQAGRCYSAPYSAHQQPYGHIVYWTYGRDSYPQSSENKTRSHTEDKDQTPLSDPTEG